MEDEVKYMIETAVLAEREACAKVADEQIGEGHRSRMRKGMKLGKLPHYAQDEIAAEERGETIASECIAKAIRARNEVSSTASPLPEASISSLPKAHRNAP
jgi:hypothetical protein